MVFTEARFIFFFGIVFAFYWGLQDNRLRKLWLLLTSYVFYGAWDWRFLLLLIGSTVVDYFVARYLDIATTQERRRVALWLSVAFNLSVLGLFKYYDFFAAQLASLLSSLGIETDAMTLGVILPVGISFYTFQTMSYTIDVYRRRLPARSSLLDVALFVAFFPQLVAGPIIRARTFLPQLDSLRHFAPSRAPLAILLCLVGYFKKSVLADNIAPFIDPVWADPTHYDRASVFAAQTFFMVQIYCDFSGYSDIAVGTAALLGFSIPRNFQAPFLSENLSQFWQRWHITLGSWFRDYVFLPLLKGSRSLVKICALLIFVMGLVGLWHGADWTFIVWGLTQGIGLAFVAILSKTGMSPRWGGAWPWIAITFLYVVITDAFFRASDLSMALQILAIDFGAHTGSAGLGFTPYAVFLLLAAVHWAWHAYDLETRVVAFSPQWLAVGFGSAFGLFLALTPRQIQPFIYFQF